MTDTYRGTNSVWSNLFRVDLGSTDTGVALKFAINVFRVLYQDNYALPDLHTFGRKNNVDTKAFAKRLKSNGILLRNAKLWLFKAATSEVLPGAKEFELTPAQTRALAVLLQTRIGVVLRQLSRDYKPLTLVEFKRLSSSISASQSLNDFIGKFVYKKMSFMIKSYGLHVEDLRGDLVYAGLYGLLRAYPRWEHDGHAMNICKTTIHNRGINLIKEHTTGSRNRLFLNEEGGFEAKSISLSSFEDPAVAESLLGNQEDSTIQVEDRRSLEQLIAKLPERKALFLSLLLGRYSDEFSAFLGEDNSSWSERKSIESMFPVLCKFFNIPNEKGRKFLSDLRSRLA